MKIKKVAIKSDAIADRGQNFPIITTNTNSVSFALGGRLKRKVNLLKEKF